MASQTDIVPMQFAWFGGILGCLTVFALFGAWITVSRTGLQFNDGY